MLHSIALAFALSVSALASTAATVSNVTTNPASPAALDFGDFVDVSFDYDMMGLSGQIFARPFSNGAITPNFSASGSPLFTGTGSQTVFFTIRDQGQVFQRVDKIRFLILGTDRTTVLSEQFFDVDFSFGTPPVAVPLPATVLLLGGGLLGLGWLGRRKAS
ncbi:MAG: PEP-CTERM sorting domain-containing protein [Pseudomonadota bacterium]